MTHLTLRPSRFPAVVLFLVVGLGCEAGPPAFEGRVADEPRPASRLAVDGRVTDAAGGNARGKITGEALGEGPAPGRDSVGGAPLPAPVPEPRSDSASPLGEGASISSGAEPDSVRSPMFDDPPGKRVEHWGTDRFPYPDHVRGLYVNAWAAGSSRRLDSLVALAHRTEINTFVIDIKDASGYVSHDTEVELAREIGATEELRIRDLPGLLDRLETEGIYPIARIVIVKDPILAAGRPDLAVQDTAGGAWVDGKGIVWLNPHDTTVWNYHLDLAREVATMGFPEIQWDYVRFPDAPRSDLERAVFRGSRGRVRAQAIRAFLNHARTELAELGTLSTADVFGVTTSSERDVGIGQVWESFIDVVDAALPMVYPSHYWEGSFGFETPNAYPYEIVHRALRDAKRRSDAVPGAGTTRPYLQDFTLGPPRYGAAEVRAQIEATYDAGFDEWILWNPGTRYTEGALEPEDGFVEEPLIRVAGGVHPVSRRHEVIDSARIAAEQAPARAGAETRSDSLDALPTNRIESDPSGPDSDRAPDPRALPDTGSVGRPDASPTPADTTGASDPATDHTGDAAPDSLRAPGP